jgi:hypothetical protein
MADISYPTDPVEIVLGDGKVRLLRYPAAALRRLVRDERKQAENPDATPIDAIALKLFHGFVDRGEFKTPEELITRPDGEPDLIEARGLKYIGERIQEAISGAKPVENPTSPAGPIVN